MQNNTYPLSPTLPDPYNADPAHPSVASSLTDSELSYADRLASVIFSGFGAVLFTAMTGIGVVAVRWIAKKFNVQERMLRDHAECMYSRLDSHLKKIDGEIPQHYERISQNNLAESSFATSPVPTVVCISPKTTRNQLYPQPIDNRAHSTFGPNSGTLRISITPDQQASILNLSEFSEDYPTLGGESSHSEGENDNHENDNHEEPGSVCSLAVSENLGYHKSGFKYQNTQL